MAAKKKENAQPEINIGLVGHVDHGKTTLTEQLSGKWTDTHSEELKRGITIRLGYADSTLAMCKKCDYYTTMQKCPECKGELEVLRKISLVDAPGHESLMATMLAGATIMDGAILMVAANEACPQPQTSEHLQALEIIGVENVIIVQNKIDLVKEEEALKNYKQIKEFIKGTKFEKAPIIPMSAQHGVNIDLLIRAIEEHIPTPKRDAKADPIMNVARSFDINKPGSDPMKIMGGVLGGSLMRGKLKVGDQVELRPGYGVEEKNQKVYKPLQTKIIGLMTGNTKVDEVGPGGSIAVMTELDPSIVKSDQITGAVVGYPDKLPEVWYDFKLEMHLLERMVGAKDTLVVEPVKMGEPLMLNVNSAATVGVITKMAKRNVEMKLKLPVCAEKGSRVTISRRVGNRWRLIGFGVIN